jgi:hypothetical protein
VTRPAARTGSTCRRATTTAPPIPGRLRDPGIHRSPDDVGQPHRDGGRRLRSWRHTPPCVVVYVDAWTAYGGPSSSTRWAPAGITLVPVRRDRALGRRALSHDYRPRIPCHRREILGRLRRQDHPMLRSDRFGALATHAGDSLYEYCYLGDFARAAASCASTTTTSSGGGTTSGRGLR